MNELPRLLLCAFEVLPGPFAGSSRRIPEYLRVLSQQFDVVVLCLKGPEQPHVQHYEGARMLRVPLPAGDLPAQVETFERAVRRQLASEEYAAVHFFDSVAGLPLCEGRSRHGGYGLLYDAARLPSFDWDVPPSFRAGLRERERVCALQADRVLTAAPLTCSYFQGLGVAPDKLHVLRTPVAFEAYPPAVLPLPEDSLLRVAYAGEPLAAATVEMLALAMSAVGHRVGVKLVMGMRRPASLEPRADALVAEQERSGRLLFLGPLSETELPDLLRGCHAGILPLHEGSGEALSGDVVFPASEYLAAGRAVIAPDLPVTRALLPGSATRFYRCNDPFSIAAQLLELARDEELRRELGQHGRRFAEETLDRASALKPLLSAYQALLGTQSEKVAKAASALTLAPHHAAGGRASQVHVHFEADAATVLANTQSLESEIPELDSSEAVLAATEETDAALVVTDEDKIPFVEVEAAADLSPHPVAEETPTSPPAPPPALQQTGQALPLPTTRTPPVLRVPPPLPNHRAPAPPSQPPAASPIPPISEGDAALAVEVKQLSVLDPWFAQLAHGYCPPEGLKSFSRHTPPTNFPGRDKPPGEQQTTDNG